jgi:hypothetical protein
LKAIDIFHQLRFMEQQMQSGITVATKSGPRTGLPALPAIARAMPLQWPLALPVLLLSAQATRHASAMKPSTLQ